jgi:hypothetical protein
MTGEGADGSAGPRVGRLTVPYMVDATRSPIDFKELDQAHVEQCARRARCGICGRRITRGPVAFIGPDDGRTCFADPWMHEPCSELAMAQCPFLAGRHDWRAVEARSEPVLARYSAGMVLVLAHNWRAHHDGAAWHFEAVGPLVVRRSTGERS